VERGEDAAGADLLGDAGAQDGPAAAALDGDEAPVGDRGAGGVGGMQLRSGSLRWRESVGELPVRVRVCQWSR
jgi:hypothetical protein